MASAVEKEILKAVKLKAGDNSQAFLKKIAKACQDLSDSAWDKLSEDAQEWANTAATAIINKEEIPDFDGNLPSSDEDEDDKPAKKKPAPKGKSKSKSDDEEEEADEDEEEADEDDEDDKPAKKKPKAVSRESAPAQRGSGVKNKIKDLIIDTPSISVEDLVKKLGKNAQVSKVTVSNIRAEFRHSLKRLEERGKLKGITLG